MVPSFVVVGVVDMVVADVAAAGDAGSPIRPALAYALVPVPVCAPGLASVVEPVPVLVAVAPAPVAVPSAVSSP